MRENKPRHIGRKRNRLYECGLHKTQTAGMGFTALMVRGQTSLMMT